MPGTAGRNHASRMPERHESLTICLVVRFVPRAALPKAEPRCWRCASGLKAFIGLQHLNVKTKTRILASAGPARGGIGQDRRRKRQPMKTSACDRALVPDSRARTEAALAGGSLDGRSRSARRAYLLSSRSPGPARPVAPHCNDDGAAHAEAPSSTVCVSARFAALPAWSAPRYAAARVRTCAEGRLDLHPPLAHQAPASTK